MTRFRVWPVLLFAAGLFLVVGDTSAQFRPRARIVPGQPRVIPLQPVPGQPFPGQQVVPAQAIVPAPAELSVVPKSAAAFISVKVSDLVEHPDLKAALEQLKKTPDALDGITELIGVPPHEIDRVTLFWPTLSSHHGPGEPVLVVTTRDAYNEARVLKALKAEPVFDHRGGRGGHDHDFPPAGVKSPVPVKGGGQGGGGPRPINLDPPKLEPLPKPPSPEPKPDLPDEDTCGVTVAAGNGPGDPLFYELPRGPFALLFLVDDRTLVFLPEDYGHGTLHLALLGQLMQKKPTGPLADAIAAGGRHTLAAGVHLPPLFREFDRRMPPELTPYAALTAARTGVLTGDLAKTAKFTLTLTFDDAAAAKRAGPVLEEGLKTLAGKATEHAAEMKDRGPHEKVLAPVLEAVAVGLKNAQVKANGNTVVATTDVDVGPPAAKAVAELLQSLSSRKQFAARTNNLKEIGLALHNYESANGKLPTNVYNAKGEAILSWRVHLLPFLEHENLYRRFKMDEPWDSENNKPLVEMMPKVFEVPGRDAPKGRTYYQGFVSPGPGKPQPKGVFGQAWFVEGDKNGRTLAGIPDGTANTIAVAEARDAVIWSKPDDLPFGEKLPPLGAEKANEFMALFFDGHIAAIPTKTDPTTLRALITVNGGEVTPSFDEPRRPGRNGPPTANPPGAGVNKERLDELCREADAVEAFLEFARADLVKQQVEVQAQTIRTRRVLELFAQGTATKREADEAKEALEIALVRLEQRESEVRIRKDQLADARRAVEEAKTPPPADKK
jgi:hypothetical protein